MCIFRGDGVASRPLDGGSGPGIGAAKRDHSDDEPEDRRYRAEFMIKKLRCSDPPIATPKSRPAFPSTAWWAVPILDCSLVGSKTKRLLE